MEAKYSSKTSMDFYQTARFHILRDSNLQLYQSLKKDSIGYIELDIIVIRCEIMYRCLNHPVVYRSFGRILGHQYIMNLLSIYNQHIGSK
jgi:hypothetical protein